MAFAISFVVMFLDICKVDKRYRKEKKVNSA
jgi:hypothetical protein